MPRAVATAPAVEAPSVSDAWASVAFVELDDLLAAHVPGNLEALYVTGGGSELPDLRKTEAVVLVNVENLGASDARRLGEFTVATGLAVPQLAV